MDEEQYDEFGNYIGPELKDEEDQDYFLKDQEELSAQQEFEPQQAELIPPKSPQQIVLYEDKKYYPDLEEVYQNAETMIQEEDTQPITQPIISTEKTKVYEEYIETVPQTTFSYEFLQSMMHKQELIRNVSVVGHLHHGKTSLMDLFVRETHSLDWTKEKYHKFTDTRLDERDRKISIKASPMSLILPDSKHKSYLLNIFDTPGHPNFSDEALSALRISDGAIVVVDAIEGVMIGTQRLIKYLVKEKIAITVLINKVDRLVLELKLPPADAYLKLKHTLEEINGIIAQTCTDETDKKKLRISPLLGNVAFGSSEYGFVFSIKSFAQKYSQFHQVNSEMFRRVLWGDYYYNQETRKFMNKPTKDYSKRTFVEFILEPLYKLLSRALSHEKEELGQILAEIGIYMRKDEYKLDSAPLLRRVCEKFFGNVSCIVDMIVQHTPTTLEGTAMKIQRYYQGMQRDPKLAEKLQEGDENGLLMACVVKMYHKPNCLQFDCLGKVFSGTIKKGMNVKVLGEKYSLDDEEDMAIKTIKNLWIYESQYRVEVNSVSAGNWFLIEGIDQAVEKMATLTSLKQKENIEIMRPIQFDTTPVVKVAIEPVIPSELPKMLEGLRKISKSYPILKTKVEESGEHVILGTGELYMDSALYDLREKYAEIEIKVSDPSVSFCETVIDTSSILCHGETPNKKNKLTIIASPLDQGLAEDIENSRICLDQQDKKTVSDFLQTKYDWDILAAKSVWAFGPDSQSPNIFLDDTLPTEVDKQLLETVREPIIQGFTWSTKEGPLCEEPLRNVKFKMTGAQISEDYLYRGGGQIIPTCRRVCYSSFLMASPRMMEPFFLSEIQCSADCLEALQLVLQRRRGHVVSEMPKPGSPLYTVRAELPIIDSFGFETDLRIHTSGQAFCLSVFDHWALLPGDPLDKSIVLKILEPSPALALAREFMIKTRRRKGLNEDVSLLKFFDDPKLLEILRQDVDYKQYI